MATPRVQLETSRPILLALFACIGLYLTRDSIGTPVVRWMMIYDPSDFPTLASLLSFLSELRIPIPPILGALEILNHQSTGSTDLITVYLYRLGFVGAYLVAIYLASSSVLRLGLSATLSLVLLAGSVLVHPGNSQIYDVLLPAFCLLFVLCIKAAADAGGPEHETHADDPPKIYRKQMPLILCIAGGFLLSMAELSRPVMIAVLPIPMAWGVLALRRLGKKHVIGFLVPIILFSGSWHAYIAGAHAQLTWSNHAGFNLRLSGMLPKEFAPTLDREPVTRIQAGRWPNLNTEIHGNNSKKIQRAVLHSMLNHPIDGAARVLRSVQKLVATPIVIHWHDPGRARHGRLQSTFLASYRLMSFVGALLLLANALRLVWYLATPRGRLTELLADPEHLLIVLGVLLIVLLSLGAGREQARIVLSVLPFYATLPRARRPPPTATAVA